METGRKGGYRLSMMRVAIDTGGTFTDCVYLQDGKLVVLKVFSTPHDPGAAVLDGLRKIAASPELVVRHGTTVGTNAMLERKGARVAFVTTEGFEDTIAIGRQARPRLYDWFQPAPECLVSEQLRQTKDQAWLRSAVQRLIDKRVFDGGVFAKEGPDRVKSGMTLCERDRLRAFGECPVVCSQCADAVSIVPSAIIVIA